MNLRTLRGNTSGFTLLELMVAIAIISILASGAISKISTLILPKVRDRVRKHTLVELRNAIENYRADKGHYPDTLNVYQGSSVMPNDYIPELQQKGYYAQLPKDPFQVIPTDNGMMKDGKCFLVSPHVREYVYISDGTDYKLMTFCALEVPGAMNSDNDPMADPVRCPGPSTGSPLAGVRCVAFAVYSPGAATW